MAKLGIVIDSRRNRIRIDAIDGVEGQWRNVPTALSGHLLLPIDDLLVLDEGESVLEEVMAAKEIISPV